MDVPLLAQIVLHPVFIIASVAVFYGFFYLLLIYESPCFKTRIGDIGWKRVDYIWILIGALGLLIQAGEAERNWYISIYSMEKSIEGNVNANLGRALKDLSGSAICKTPVSHNKDPLAADTERELALACEEFSKIRPAQLDPLIIDWKLRKLLRENYLDKLSYENPVIVAKINRVKNMFALYEEQSVDVAQAHEKTLPTLFNNVLKFLAPLFLVIAVALRLSKVTGEIRLKTHPITQKEEIDVPAKASIDDVGGSAVVGELEKLGAKLDLISTRVHKKYNVLVLLVGLIAVSSIFLVFEFGFFLLK